MTSSRIIADTGFWVALLNKRDSHHQRAVTVLSSIERRLITTWPVMTETCHILLRQAGPEVNLRFLDSWVQSQFDVFDINPSHGARLHALMQQYAALPMDLADASLVLVAEEIGRGDILSTDQRDFQVYRWKRRRPFRNLLLS